MIANSDAIQIQSIDSPATRKRALKWFQRSALGPVERHVLVGWNTLTLLAAYAGVGVLAAWLSELIQTGMDCYSVALVSIGLYAVTFQFACTFFNQRIGAANLAEGKTDPVYTFTSQGVEMSDNYRGWTSDWRFFPRIFASEQGLFLGSQGAVFYLPTSCWSDPAAYEADTARITAWWQAARDTQQ